MHSYRGITWDHPRGHNALAAAAAALDPQRDQLRIAWDRQSLEEFESHPIKDLCARYDLVVLDHPHVGEAVRDACLRPLDEMFPSEVIFDMDQATIGPCFDSYRFAGQYWALPLDAATQVMALRADLHATPPRTWAEVTVLSEAAAGRVAMSLAGPHALLSFLSIAAAFGEASATRNPDLLVSTETGTRVFDLMAGLVARSPESLRDRNPIGILEHMAGNDDVILCPLVYGYVNYAAPKSGKPIRFVNAPRAMSHGRPGSTLGGTGIGVSRRCELSESLNKHLLWLMGDEAQSKFIPAHDGQPSRRSAWADPELNAVWGDFYRNTADTLEAAYVRPRHAGYISFQAKASALLGEALCGGEPAVPVLEKLQAMYRASRAPGGEA